MKLQPLEPRLGKLIPAHASIGPRWAFAIASAALVALVFATVSPAPANETDSPCGDANSDGSLNATDALGALSAAIGVQNCSVWQCDVNNDGQVSSADALGVLMRAVGNAAKLDCPTPPAAQDEENDRVEIINDPQRLDDNVDYTWEPLKLDPVGVMPQDESTGRIRIINDRRILSDKIARPNIALPIEQAGPGHASISVSLDLVADVAAPQVAGRRLQATTIHPGATNSHFLVAYNMAGPAKLGGLDYFSLADPAVPELRSEALFSDADVHHVTSDGNAVYIATSSADESFDAAAVMEVLELRAGHLTLAGNRRRSLSSYAANSSVVSRSTIYATTGNHGHLFALDPTDLSVKATSLLDDARWVDVDDGKIVVVQGTPGRIATFDQDTFAPLGTFSFDGARAPEAKSTVQLVGGKAFIAAGRAGVHVLSTVTGALLGRLNIPELPADTLIERRAVVSNAISIVGRVAFVSNGGAGVYVAILDEDPATTDSESPVGMHYYGRLTFNGVESINHVWYTGENLIVAAGRGGVKVVRVVINLDGEADAPIAEYRMDACEWPGTEPPILNSASQTLDATVMGEARVAEGLLCRAGETTEPFGRIEARVAPESAPTNEVTIMAWLRWDMAPQEGTPSAVIAELRSGNDVAAPLFVLRHGQRERPNDRFEFEIQTTAGHRIAQSRSGPDNGRWTQLTGVYDGAALRVYVDGKLENTVSHDGRLIEQGLGTLLLAGDADAGSMIGRLDEILVFDSALSALQIEQIHVRHLGGKGWDGADRYCEECSVSDWCLPEDGTSRCDDDNPCTLDECTATGCINESLTGTPCTDDVACTDDVCVEGVCMSTTNCASGAECSPRLDECVEPCVVDTDCDDGNACTDDVCSAEACTWSLNTGACDDGVSCTLDDRCTFGICIGVSSCPDGLSCDEAADRCLRRCVTAADCDDDNICTFDACDAGACTHSTDGDCGDGCLNDADCDDGDSCTIGACMFGECTYAVPTLCPPNHCSDDADCNDGEPCTEDRCEAETCHNRRVDQCSAGCVTDADCDDTDRCTIDRCVAGSCLAVPIDPCDECEINAECDDGDPCTDDGCESGSCRFAAQLACGGCTTDAECIVAETETCREGRCIQGECMIFPLRDCIGGCESDSDCDDEDVCTQDHCVRGHCESIAAPECPEYDNTCDGHGDCSTDDPCLQGRCNDWHCEYVGVPGCGAPACATDLDCEDDSSCTFDFCIDAGCVHEAIPGCGEAQCRADADCDDADPCTFNSCVAGGCEAVGRADCRSHDGAEREASLEDRRRLLSDGR